MNNESNLLEVLTKWNIWGRLEWPSGISRDVLEHVSKHIDGQKIIALQGIRRSGKSTLFYQIIQFLAQSQRVDPRRTLYVNFEDPYFADRSDIGVLDEVFKTYRRNINPEGFPYLFLDEIQNIERWEKWVRTKSELKEAKIFVTGSSAKLLGSEIATVLTGRHVSFVVYPLSFKEFLRFRGVQVGDQADRMRQADKVRHLLLEYLHFGGMPEVVLTAQEEKKEILLKQYFEDILFRDVVARHQIRDVATLRKLALYYLTNVSNLVSYNRIKNTYGMPMDVVRSYSAYLVESYLLAEQSKFAFKVREQQIAPKKIYATDTGIRNCVAFRFSEDLGRLAENAVFNALRPLGLELYYAHQKSEVDFVVKKGTRIVQAIQVSFSDLRDQRMFQRECAGLKETAQKYGLASGVIVTDDRREEIQENGLKIFLIPLLDFLMGNVGT